MERANDYFMAQTEKCFDASHGETFRFALDGKEYIFDSMINGIVPAEKYNDTANPGHLCFLRQGKTAN